MSKAGISLQKIEKSHLIDAINNGCRLVDTMKGNENSINEAIGESNIPLDDVAVMTKLPHIENREALRKAVEESAQQLGKVPELFLIPDPSKTYLLSLLHEQEMLKKEDKVKEYGVCNLDRQQLQFLIDRGAKPTLNQVEYHPYFQRPELLKFCQENGIVLQAYEPLSASEALSDHTIQTIAGDHHVSTACIIYSWLAQLGIPMVANETISSDLIELSASEMDAIASLNKTVQPAPFTAKMQKQWRTEELKELKRHCDVLNIEGGRIPNLFNGKWANVGVVLDHPFSTGIDLDELTSNNKRFRLKEALIPEYNENKISLTFVTILKYYVEKAHEIAKKNRSENVHIVFQVHRGASSHRPIEQLESALKLCFGDEFKVKEGDHPFNTVAAYNSENAVVEFRKGYEEGTIGNYENADIVVSLSMLAGFNEQLPSGSLVLPGREFIPMSLHDMVMRKCDSYHVKNHLAEHIEEVLDVQTQELIDAINKEPLFASENQAKNDHKALWLKKEDFSPATLLQVDGIFNPKKLPDHFSVAYSKEDLEENF